MKTKTKKMLKKASIAVLVFFSLVCSSLYVSAEDDLTITQTIYNYYSGSWDDITPSDDNVKTAVDSYGNGAKAYKYLYDGKTVKQNLEENTAFSSKKTAGEIDVYSKNTNGQTWHITSYVADIDNGRASDWPPELNRQPKVTLRCNGTDIYTLQEASTNVEQNGSASGLNLTCNGTISWHSYGWTGDGRNYTTIGGLNKMTYYVETTASNVQSDWVWNTTYLDGYISGTVNATGYVYPTYTLNQSAWASTAYTKSTYSDDYVKGTTVKEPISATVTFNGNGATSKGTTYNDFKKTGYTLNDKMYTNANCTGTSFSRSNPSYANFGLDNNSKLTLYACYTANTYTINFNVNGGSNAPSSITKTYGTDTKLPTSTPSKEGYVFIGWSIDGKTYKAGATLSDDLTTENNVSVTLDAIWMPIKYNINFDANGGTGAPSTVIKTYGTDLVLPTQAPTRDGYDFYGWSMKKDTIVKGYGAGETISEDFEATSEEGITLYAVWVSRAYVTLATQDVYIKLNSDQEEAVKLALSYQNVSDINYDISKDDIVLKKVVYEDGTFTNEPIGIDTSKAQTITATYAVTGNDGVERTSTSYIYVYVQAVDEEGDVVDEPTAIFGRFINCDMAQYGIFYSDSIYKRESEYSKYLQSVCEGNRSVLKTKNVERGE